MRCPNCNQEISDSAHFCGHCGHRLEEVEAVKPAEPGPPPPEPVPKKLPPELEATRLSKPGPPPQPPQPPEVEAKKPESEEPTPKPPVAPAIAKPMAPKPKRGLPGWVLGLVGLVIVAVIVGALVITGVIDFGSTQPAVTHNDAVPAITPTSIAVIDSGSTQLAVTCQGPISEWVEIESAWLNQPVEVDGKLTNQQEWSDAPCLDLTLREPDDSDDSMPSRWWIKNDAEWLYLLVRVPAEELIDGPAVTRYGAAINFFWPEWSEVSGWPYSDAGSIRRNNTTGDQYGWDDERWLEDTQASPPGENNVEGATSEDGTYVWFEFRKALDSGDDRDWSWLPGETIDYGSLLLGVWGTTDGQWFEIATVLHLAE
jgi:hypothetical protein